jgi:hypothetical protein
MGIVALVAWLATAGAGLYLLAVWLIEYDRDVQAASATRLPVPVISAHALLAIGGLITWSAYLFLDQQRLAWIAVAAVLGAAVLGLTMAVRWFGVYRETSSPPAELAPPAELSPAHAGSVAAQDGPAASPFRLTASPAVPPERYFPLSVVITHGVLAVSTVILVLLTALGFRGG